MDSKEFEAVIMDTAVFGPDLLGKKADKKDVVVDEVVDGGVAKADKPTMDDGALAISAPAAVHAEKTTNSGGDAKEASFTAASGRDNKTLDEEKHSAGRTGDGLDKEDVGMADGKPVKKVDDGAVDALMDDNSGSSKTLSAVSDKSHDEDGSETAHTVVLMVSIIIFIFLPLWAGARMAPLTMPFGWQILSGPSVFKACLVLYFASCWFIGLEVVRLSLQHTLADEEKGGGKRHEAAEKPARKPIDDASSSTENGEMPAIIATVTSSTNTSSEL